MKKILKSCAERSRSITMLAAVLLMLAGNLFAQSNDFTTAPSQNDERKLKRETPFSKNNTSFELPKHIIAVDLYSFRQSLELDADGTANPLTYPQDARVHGAGFHRKLNPWKFVYKYNLNYNSNSATFLRAGVLGFFRKDYKEMPAHKRWRPKTSLNLLYTCYGAFAGVEKWYSLTSSLNFILAVDFGYYYSEFRDHVEDFQYTDLPYYYEEIDTWAPGWYTYISNAHSYAHHFVLMPSIQMEYTFLKKFALGAAVNFNIRYYYKTNTEGKFYTGVQNDPPQHDVGRSYGPLPHRQFSVGLTPSIYFSYKF
jgi:hypothetical protein